MSTTGCLRLSLRRKPCSVCALYETSVDILPGLGPWPCRGELETLPHRHGRASSVVLAVRVVLIGRLAPPRTPVLHSGRPWLAARLLQATGHVRCQQEIHRPSCESSVSGAGIPVASKVRLWPSGHSWWAFLGRESFLRGVLVWLISRSSSVVHRSVAVISRESRVIFRALAACIGF